MQVQVTFYAQMIRILSLQTPKVEDTKGMAHL